MRGGNVWSSFHTALGWNEWIDDEALHFWIEFKLSEFVGRKLESHPKCTSLKMDDICTNLSDFLHVSSFLSFPPHRAFTITWSCINFMQFFSDRVVIGDRRTTFLDARIHHTTRESRNSQVSGLLTDWLCIFPRYWDLGCTHYYFQQRNNETTTLPQWPLSQPCHCFLALTLSFLDLVVEFWLEGLPSAVRFDLLFSDERILPGLLLGQDYYKWSQATAVEIF